MPDKTMLVSHLENLPRRLWLWLKPTFVAVGWYCPQQETVCIRSLAGGLTILWMLSMIALPILLWVFGWLALPWGIALGVLTQLAAVLAFLSKNWTWPRLVGTSLAVICLTWLAEALGTATGFPFGRYHYSDLLWPQVAHVPLLIPIAWMMLLPSAWSVAACLLGRWRGWDFVLLSALALTVWDLFLDPQMVAWSLWIWADPNGYFGIPWQNFSGWLLVSALITWLVRPKPLSWRPFLLIYTLTWLLESIGLAFFWGLPGPALVGFLAMGGLLVMAWYLAEKRETAHD